MPTRVGALGRCLSSIRLDHCAAPGLSRHPPLDDGPPPSDPRLMAKHLLAIDQGTTGSTALVVEIAAGGGATAAAGRTLGRATVEFPQHFPKPGWVSHDTREIWHSVEASVKEAVKTSGARPADIAAIGITNQRETTVVWDRATRRPIDLAIVWQCRRTADVCDGLKKDPHTVARVREKTGLVIDAYFSATKIAWLLDHVMGARALAERGKLAFGTIDCFLVSELTGGAVHATDVTNASRTLLMNLSRAEWDPELLDLFHVPESVLPSIVGNAEIVGRTQGVGFLPDGLPIAGMAGDQQAALFGQACFAEGDAKCTYGTGAFALMNIGARPLLSEHGLVTTAAWRIGGQTTYALEGSAFVAGAAVQWLRDGLGIIKSARDIEALARATLEGIAFEVRDLLDAMARDAKRPLARLRVDGGAAANDLLMQFQADVAGVVVERPSDIESTGRGAAMLAGFGAGIFKGFD